jgi:hypothetical protein
MLQLVITPVLLLPLSAGLALALCAAAGLRWPARALLCGLAVNVGRSPEIAAASTSLAARLLHQGRVREIYVSGDGPGTAQRLLQLGVPPERIDGASSFLSPPSRPTLTFRPTRAIVWP